jgi:membrane protein implicated in regulation of membrane protease activity
MALTIYLICLGVGFLFTLFSAIFGHVFGHGGHDSHVGGSGGHAEAGVDASDMPGVSAFSPTIIASFVTAFGGFGVIFHQIPSTRSPWISAPLAVASGFLTAAGVLALLRQLFSKTQSSSESKVGSLVGQMATIITPIPENGVGEIAYVQAGTRYSAPARESNGAAVAVGKSVRIVRVVGTQFYVESAP